MKIQVHKDEPSWLAARKRRLTSSDIPPLLGCYASEASKEYRNPYSIWMQKTGKTEDPDAGAMRLRFDLGHIVEDRVAQEVERREKIHLLDLGDYTTVSEGILMATPDRLIVPAGLGGNWTVSSVTTSEEAAFAHEKIRTAIESSTGPCEIKSDGVIYDSETWSSGAKYDYSLIQAHVPAMVMQKQGGLIAAVFGLGLGFEVYPFAVNDKLVALIQERAEELWECVLTDTPPGAQFLDDSEAIGRSLATLYGPDSGETVELDSEAKAQLEHLEEIKEQIKALQGTETLIKNHIRHAMGSATWATIPGAEKKWQWKTETKAAHHREKSSSRVLRLVKA